MTTNLDRSGPKVLRYRKQVRIVATIWKILLPFVALCLVLMGLLFGISVKNGLAVIHLGGLLSLGVVGIGFYLPYRLFLKPLATCRIQVFPDHLLIWYGKPGKKEIT